ncbi:MAG: peptidylprolyl isomerase [Planctomycetes bacterium]|nr:peptidylprolyl isomerase [Planctomycetota bacterium]
MISESTLRNLAVTAGVLVIASVWVGVRERTTPFRFNKGQLLLPDLDPERIAGIEVKHEQDTVVLKRAGGQFLVESAKNYPANNREVNDLTKRVLGIRLADEVTSDKDAYEGLGVSEAKATTIRFLDNEGKDIVVVLTGKSEKGQDHVRLASSDTVYRVEEGLYLRTKALDYVDKQLLQLERNDIAKVDVAPAGGKVYSIESPEAGKVQLAGIPAGKKAKGTEPDGVFGAATYLSFDEFQSEAEAKDLDFANLYTVRTRLEAEYRFELAKKDDKWFVRARAAYHGPRELSVEGKSKEELERNEKLANAAKAVEAFNAKHQSWVYQLGSWKADSMTKAFDDLVQDDDGRPEKVTASHILIPWQGAERAPAEITRTKDEAKALADSLLAQVVADPSKLPELAQANSSCPSKEKGGDLGEFPFEQMSKPFSEAAFSLKVGEVAPQVVETEFGWHIIQRTK